MRTCRASEAVTAKSDHTSRTIVLGHQRQYLVVSPSTSARSLKNITNLTHQVHHNLDHAKTTQYANL